jgi:hypothetical protein
MTRSVRRWGFRHLLLGWVAYWVLLAIAVLRTPVMIAWRLSQLPDGHSSISADLGNAGFHVTMSQEGTVVWAGSVHLLTAALWIGLPPLAMWFAWFVRRSKSEPRRDEPRDEVVGA